MLVACHSYTNFTFQSVGMSTLDRVQLEQHAQQYRLIPSRAPTVGNYGYVAVLTHSHACAQCTAL
jgi:hypothetical protein